MERPQSPARLKALPSRAFMVLRYTLAMANKQPDPSQPRARSLTMPQDAPHLAQHPPTDRHASEPSVSHMLKLLLMAQQETNTLLKDRLHRRNSLFTRVQFWAYLFLVVCLLGGIALAAIAFMNGAAPR